jgi:hypothetical protein
MRLCNSMFKKSMRCDAACESSLVIKRGAEGVYGKRVVDVIRKHYVTSYLNVAYMYGHQAIPHC